jgi:hypothetical protein
MAQRCVFPTDLLQLQHSRSFRLAGLSESDAQRGLVHVICMVVLVPALCTVQVSDI